MVPERSKLPVKDSFLKRPRLEALLEEGLGHSLLVVVAGPGYGKTVTVAAFVKPLEKRLVWLLFKRADNNIQRFWSSFVFALREELPEVAGQLNEVGVPDSPGKFDTFLHIFTKGLYDGEQVIMVVDDFYLVKEPEVRLFFMSLIDMDLENFCLILIGEAYSDLGVLSFSINHMAMVITMSDLRFSQEEAAGYFAECGTALPEKDVHRIVAESDGWPMALCYTRLRLQAGDRDYFQAEPEPFALAGVLFENRFFLEYPAEIQQLFIRLSVLTRFPLEIVRRLYPGDANDACDFLASNIFVAYDYKTGIYTFQGMYHKFLVSKQGLLDEEAILQAYEIAGDWMFDEGNYLEAISCFRNCYQYPKMLEAIDRLPHQRIGKEATEYLLACLDAYGRDYRQGEPLVDFHRGSLYKCIYEMDRAREVLLALHDRLVGDGQLCEENRMLLGEVYFLLADFSMVDTPKEFVDNMRKAAELLPGGSRYRKREIMYLPFTGVIFLPDNSADQLTRMVDVFFKITEYESLSSGSGYGFEWLFAAEAAFKTCQLDRAKENCFLAIHKAKEMDQHDIVCNAGVLLMRMAMFSGDYSEVALRVSQLEEYISSRNLIPLFELRDISLGWLYIKLGDLDRVPRWITDEESVIYTQQPIITGRGKLVYAYYLMARHDFYKASAVLLQAERRYAISDQWSLRLAVNIAKAECFYKNDSKERALDALWDAYEMTYANNLIVPFIEVGNVMRSIIEYARKSDRYSFDTEWLDSIYQKASTYAKRLASIISAHQRVNKIKPDDATNGLTPRENEALQCLVQGLTREEMADSLDISISGVKKHITNIYNKLGAINKVDAIHIALTNDYIQPKV